VAAAGPYATADAAMRARVRADDLQGGVLLVARGDDVLHRLQVGDTTARTVMPIASASKWMTSATLMTFVDQGKLSLDDPVAAHRPGSANGRSTVRVRELLSHPSGLPAPDCEGDPSTTLARCVRSIAVGAAPASPPGTEFHYSGVGFVVAGRIIERLS